MEDGLGHTMNKNKGKFDVSLNPCFSGRWPRTWKIPFRLGFPYVLILVVMEDGLGQVS